MSSIVILRLDDGFDVKKQAWRPVLLGMLCRYLALCASSAVVFAAESNPAALLLRDGWSLQPSVDVHETGAVLSSTSFKPHNWYRAHVPSTVFNALVESRVYADP